VFSTIFGLLLVVSLAATFVLALIALWRALPQGGWGPLAVQWRGPTLVAFVLVLTLLGGLRLLDSLQQDRAAEAAAVEGFEREKGEPVRNVYDFVRRGNCAVVWINYGRGDALSPGLATAVVVFRADDGWQVGAISDSTGDSDGFYEEQDCLAYVEDR